jgi:hypothetical protein
MPLVGRSLSREGVRDGADRLDLMGACVVKEMLEGFIVIDLVALRDVHCSRRAA